MKKYFLLTVLCAAGALIGLRAQTESESPTATATATDATSTATTDTTSGASTSTAATTTTAAASSDQHVVVTPGELKWGEAPPSLPAGAKLAVLEGDPTRPGPFTIRLKVPSGYKVAPHTHPTTEKITVIAGTFNIGSGPTAEWSKAKALKTGGFVVLPAGMQHYASVKGETVIQVSSDGPFVINYVNPADDPSAKKK
jgi:anti-sigma factor ChrR (cupin superfamily)